MLPWAQQRPLWGYFVMREIEHANMKGCNGQFFNLGTTKYVYELSVC